MTWVLLIAFLVGSALVSRHIARRHARHALLAAGLSETHRNIIARQVPLLAKLPQSLRAGLEGKINLFMSQVEFIGCDGLEVTDEMRVSIAAQACMLVVNSDAWYSHLRTILIYPGAFKSLREDRDGYVVTEKETVRLGESWARGPVILSWAHSERGALNPEDGHNVVLHEFAHQIDDLSGHTDGAPLMRKGQSFDEWSRVFLSAYETHVGHVEEGRLTVLDAYGAIAHEEFFAVAVEVFFEKPEALLREEPEVYTQISELFGLDPANWG